MPKIRGIRDSRSSIPIRAPKLRVYFILASNYIKQLILQIYIMLVYKNKACKITRSPTIEYNFFVPVTDSDNEIGTSPKDHEVVKELTKHFDRVEVLSSEYCNKAPEPGSIEACIKGIQIKAIRTTPRDEYNEQQKAADMTYAIAITEPKSEAKNSPILLDVRDGIMFSVLGSKQAKSSPR